MESRGAKPGNVILGKYRIVDEIGAGAFGRIFSAQDITTQNFVAIKQESVRARSPQLELEYKTYLKFLDTTNFPEVYFFGTEGDYRYLVFQLLGKSLEDLLVRNQRPLSLKTVLMLADQMLQSIEYFHKKSLIHRDIKPDNFMMGSGKCANEVFIIDYGLSKEYRNPVTHTHRPYTDGLSLTGTARYASVNALRGCEQSRRDDLESLGYVWMYLLRGSLPWQGLPAKTTAQKYAKILEVKSRTPLDVLCSGFPHEFITYLSEVKKLGFTDEPDYARYRQMFRNLFVRNAFSYDYIYDWSIGAVHPPNKIRQPSTQPNTPRRSIRHQQNQPLRDKNLQQSKETLPMLAHEAVPKSPAATNPLIVPGNGLVPHINTTPTKNDGVVTFGMSPTPEIKRPHVTRSPEESYGMHEKSRNPSPRNSARRIRTFIFRRNALCFSDPHFVTSK